MLSAGEVAKLRGKGRPDKRGEAMKNALGLLLQLRGRVQRAEKDVEVNLRTRGGTSMERGVQAKMQGTSFFVKRAILILKYGCNRSQSCCVS